MRKAWVGFLAIWGTALAIAACVGDEPAPVGGSDPSDGGSSDGTTAGDGPSDDGSPSGDSGGDSGVDSGPKCGFPGEACCAPPLAACNTGTACMASVCRANDIWAVGYYNEGFSGPSVGVSLHYDGTSWTKGPEIKLTVNNATVAPQSVWSTTGGLYYTVTDEPSAFIYASASWKKCGVSNCSLPSTGQPLWAIYGFSSDDYWIAGSSVMFRCSATGCVSTTTGLTGTWGQATFSGPSSNDLWYGALDRVFHYDGANWTIMTGRHASAVFALNNHDVWAAGGGVIEHYDGASWSAYAFAKPDGGAPGNVYAMHGTATDDVWVAGQENNGPDFTGHWNGTGWTYYPLPASTNGFANAIYAVSKTEAYALAFSSPIYKWNGSAWSEIPTPDYDSGLFEVTASYQALTGTSRPRP